jgi:beta-lactam-binding protein with PASTA domain
LKQLGLAIVAIILLVWLFLIGLSWLTHHGEAVNVPQIKGLTYDNAEDLLDERGLELVVMDSTFVLGKKPGMVLEQDPKPNTPVKPGRKIYVSIQVTCPPFIKMPNLKDASMRQAAMMLKSNGLNMGRIIYKPDYANNVVLEMQYKGRTILPGTQIRKGSYVDLVIANGVGSDEIMVPELVGLSLEEARVLLNESKISLSAVVFDKDVSDTSTAIIWRQSPDIYTDKGELRKIHLGAPLDVWLTNDLGKVESHSDSTSRVQDIQTEEE